MEKTPNKPQPKTKHPIVRTGRPVLSEQQSGWSVQESENVSNVTAKAPMNEQGDLFSSCVPVSVKLLDQDNDTDKDVDADHVRTGRLVYEQPTGSSTQLEEVDIDFRVSALPHAFVKQAENSRVRELAKKIESHSHRQDLQAVLQRNNAYNPFSEKSKKMIKDMGNVELFELCETLPKVQCKECLLYWNQGIVYCTCGHLLRENQSSRGIIRLRTMSLRRGDIMAIVMGRLKNKENIAHNLRKRRIKKGFEGIHDRFQNDSTFRESLLSIDRTEEVCIQMDKDAQKYFTYRMTEDEYFRYKKNCWISLNTSGKIGPMRDRSDFNEALTKLHRLHSESGEVREERFLTGNTRNGIRRLLHPAHLGGSGTIPGGAHEN